MSKKYSFPYINAPKPAGPNISKDWQKKPLLPVKIRHQGIIISYLALVDSGADFNVFHGDIAELLGIDLSKLTNKVKFSGVKDDKTPCVGYLATVDLGIGKNFFDSVVMFSNDISDDGYGIVGQAGFFTNFEISFIRSKYTFELKED